MIKYLGFFPKKFKRIQESDDFKLNSCYCEICKLEYDITKYSDSLKKWICEKCAKKNKINFKELL